MPVKGAPTRGPQQMCIRRRHRVEPGATRHLWNAHAVCSQTNSLFADPKP